MDQLLGAIFFECCNGRRCLMIWFLSNVRQVFGCRFPSFTIRFDCLLYFVGLMVFPAPRRQGRCPRFHPAANHMSPFRVSFIYFVFIFYRCWKLISSIENVPLIWTCFSTSLASVAPPPGGKCGNWTPGAAGVGLHFSLPLQSANIYADSFLSPPPSPPRWWRHSTSII